jgi:hypothetical protein
VDLVRREPFPDDVIPVVRVAAVDHGIAGLQQLGQLIQRRAGDGGWQHQPRRPGLLQLRDEVRKRGRAGRALALQLLHVGFGVVIDDAAVAVPHQPADEVGTHPPEPDHAELHGPVSGHFCSLDLRAVSSSGCGSGG